MRSNALPSRVSVLALGAALALAAVPLLAGSEPLELVELMKLRTIHGPVISEDGAWVAYELRPDRGDGELVVRAAEGRRSYTVARGSGAAISADSRWVAALVRPTLEEREAAERAKKTKEEGPKTGLAQLATADGAVVAVERVESFAFSPDGRWLAYHRFRDEDTKEEAAAATEEPAPETRPEAVPEVEGVPVPSLPAEPEPGEPAPAPEPAAEEPEAAKDEKKEDERLGATLVLRELATGREIEIPHVEAYAFAATSAHLAYAVAAPEGEGNGMFLRALGEEGTPETALRREPRGRYTALAWTGEAAAASRLGFVAAVDDEDGEPGEGTLQVWDGELATALGSEAAPEGWFVPPKNELAWSDDGRRLFFGLKPDDEKLPEDEDDEPETAGEDAAADEEAAEAEGAPGGEEEPPFDPYDLEALLEERAVDVWHWNDPLIVSHQKERWKEEKDRVYRAVFHVAAAGSDPGAPGRAVPLADRELRLVEPADNPAAALGRADVPYLKEITWDGWYTDLYRVRLADGSRQLVAERLREGPAALSPGGRYAVYWRTPHWHLFDGDTGETRNLTEGLPVPFADEDHDAPEPAPGYGAPEWVARPSGGGSSGEPAAGPAEATAVLLQDKFDLWRFPLDGGEPELVTAGEGRRRRLVFRRVDLDPPGRERDWVEPEEPLLLSAYHDREKHRGFAEARLDEPGVRFL
ncbi:MAG TPA: hypothetical protein VJG13_10450, partial [Thermoanaerobaculia bacterium]|nr:hypothetical protein [Thermoanaerobaculia bacterium]